MPFPKIKKWGMIGGNPVDRAGFDLMGRSIKKGIEKNMGYKRLRSL